MLLLSPRPCRSGRRHGRAGGKRQSPVLPAREHLTFTAAETSTLTGPQTPVLPFPTCPSAAPGSRRGPGRSTFLLSLPRLPRRFLGLVVTSLTPGGRWSGIPWQVLRLGLSGLVMRLGFGCGEKATEVRAPGARVCPLPCVGGVAELHLRGVACCWGSPVTLPAQPFVRPPWVRVDSRPFVFLRTPVSGGGVALGVPGNLWESFTVLFLPLVLCPDMSPPQHFLASAPRDAPGRLVPSPPRLESVAQPVLSKSCACVCSRLQHPAPGIPRPSPMQVLTRPDPA